MKTVGNQKKTIQNRAVLRTLLYFYDGAFLRKMIAAKSRFNCLHMKPSLNLDSVLDAILQNSSKIHYSNTVEKYNDAYIHAVHYVIYSHSAILNKF